MPAGALVTLLTIGALAVPARAATPPALVLAAEATPAALPASGATVTVTGRVANATRCWLEVLSRQSFPVVFSRDPRSCTSGHFQARVTIGPNPTPLPRTVALALVASNAASGYQGRFYVRLQPGATSASPVPPATPLAPSAAQLVEEDSSNWSGYVAVGGPFSAVRGTFRVPTSVGGPYGSQVSEWVGLDGTGSGDPSLIQAGVSEAPEQANPYRFSVRPWWEVLPSAETPINGLDVRAGDQVSVTIWQVGPQAWEVNLTDTTTGQSFTSPPEHYSGPGLSADWIVEAATQCSYECQPSMLASFSPAVSFSALGMAGAPQTSLDEVAMVQGFRQVSTPSELAPGGFSVSYTGWGRATRAEG